MINNISKYSNIAPHIKVPEINVETFQGAIKNAQSIMKKSITTEAKPVQVAVQSGYIKQQAKNMYSVGIKDSLIGSKFNALG